MHPDARSCPQFKACTVTNLWLRYSLYRDTAPVLATSFVTGDNFAAPIKLVPRSGSNSQTFQYKCKTYAILSLHRDCSLAKVTGSARCLRRVTQPSFIAVPLCAMGPRGVIYLDSPNTFYRLPYAVCSEKHNFETII
jgi:hypothetical protein